MINNMDFSFSSNIASLCNQISLKSNSDDNHFIEYSSTTSFQSDSIFQLAKAFLNIAPMTHKKLQKLCYYAKAWYLALNNSNLVTEPFQAWVHGAVQPGLYHKYKQYGFSMIPQVTSTDGIPEEFMSFAREVYAAYGHLSGDELEAINHKEDPWRKARGSCKPWENCENVISEEDMKSYYRKMM